MRCASGRSNPSPRRGWDRGSARVSSRASGAFSRRSGAASPRVGAVFSLAGARGRSADAPSFADARVRSDAGPEARARSDAGPDARARSDAGFAPSRAEAPFFVRGLSSPSGRSMAPNGTDWGVLFVCWSSGPKMITSERGFRNVAPEGAGARHATSPTESGGGRAWNAQGESRLEGSRAPFLRPGDADVTGRGLIRTHRGQTPAFGALVVRARSDSSPASESAIVLHGTPCRTGARAQTWSPLQRSGTGGVPFGSGSSQRGGRQILLPDAWLPVESPPQPLRGCLKKPVEGMGKCGFRRWGRQYPPAGCGDAGQVPCQARAARSVAEAIILRP